MMRTGVGGERRLLLVEDERKDEALTLRAFRQYHLTNEVVVAHDGVEALEYLFGTGAYEGRPPDDVPQLVLLDLKLPRIDGFEVLRRLRADPRTKLVPVVVLTSSDEERDRLAGYALGANSYVRKPIEFTEFAEAIRTLGLYWLILNLPPPAVRPPTTRGAGPIEPP
jgi:CheY-like chemotaxis protein